MRLTSSQARERFAGERIARLATVHRNGAPHLVPVVFALDGDQLHLVVDDKPKSTTALQRLANIAVEPRVCLLADHYDEDWTQLWWARADGEARVVERDEDAVELFTVRYAQYRERRPSGPIVTVDITRWSGWSAGTSTRASDHPRSRPG